MNDALKDLYSIPPDILPRNDRLIELVQECGRAEHCVQILLESLPAAQKAVAEEYMQLRDAVELQAVRQAMKFGKICK